METSIRYGGDSRALKFHAKENLPIDSNTNLQVHGELDTKNGAPSYLSAMIRHFYPDLSASLGVGLQYDRKEKLRYSVRGKKSFPVTPNGLLRFNIKGRCDVDKEFKERKSRGAAEFTWGILNFQKDQDIRLKVGYEVFDKVVASMDWPEVTKYRGLVSAQPHRDEIINDLYKTIQDPQRGTWLFKSPKA